MNEIVKSERTIKLDDLFTQWRRKVEQHNFIEDGIVDEYIWITTKLKVLFLLKDANDEGGTKDWDLRGFLRQGAFDGTQGYTATWGLIARYAYGIQKGFCTWIATEFKNSGVDFSIHTQRQDYLKSIAVMNIKKSGGAGTNKWDELEDAVRSSRSFILDEIGIIAPDVIVAGGTGWLIPKIFTEPGSLEEVTLSTGVMCQKLGNENCYILHYYHPQARYPHNLMYMALMESLRELYGIIKSPNPTK